MRKIILGVLLLVLATNVAGATDYYIDDDYRMILPISVGAGELKTLYLAQEGGHTPDASGVLLFVDDFNGGSFSGDWGTVDTEWSVVDGKAKHTLDSGIWNALGASLASPDGVYYTKFKISSDGTNDELAFFVRGSGTPYSDSNTLQFISRLDNPDYAYVDYGSTTTISNPSSYDTWQYYKIVCGGTNVLWYTSTDGDNWSLIKSTSTGHTTQTHIGFRGIQSTSYVDYIYKVPYLDAEPSWVVADMGDYYKITIINNDDEPLTNYPLIISSSELGITSTTESWNVDYNPTGDEFTPATVYAYDIADDLSNVYFEADVPASSTEIFYVVDEAGHNPAVLEYALNFDGSNDYASVPHSSQLTLTDYFKIRTTVRIDSGVGSGHWTALVSKGSGTVSDGGGEDHNYCLGIENNLFTGGQTLILLFENSAGANYDVTYDLSNLNFGEWYLIEGEWDTSTDELILYVNGVEVSKETGVTGTPNINTQAVTIGIPCISAGNMEYFDGVIGEIEILSSTGRVAKYELNDGVGATLTDKTGSHTGTIDGATWVESEPFDTSSVSTTVVDVGNYYKISVTNNDASGLVDYPIPIPCNQIGVSSTTQSILITDEAPAEEEVYYDPTPGGRYSDQFSLIFPNDAEEMTVWSMIKNTIAAWGISVGSEIFWLFILPIPIAAYWIMTNSTELPIVVYLILGGIFVKVAPEVMQTPARIMLMFGITGMLYHFFKNRG